MGKQTESLAREKFEAWMKSRDCKPVAWLKDAYWEVWQACCANSPELPDGWTNNGLADSALVMLDRVDAIGPDDDARIEEVKQIIRQLGAPHHGEVSHEHN